MRTISFIATHARKAFILVCLAATLPFAQSGAFFRVNCGGMSFVDNSWQIWKADAHFTGGQDLSSVAAILNTDIPRLYQSERGNDPSVGNLVYSFDLRPGQYTVNLHFAEVSDDVNAAGQRVFDVNINGSIVKSDLDVFAQVGARTPLILDFKTTAVEGRITIGLTNKTGKAKISGIEILPLDPPRATSAPYRVSCGGQDYIDARGNYWEADGHFVSGVSFATANALSGTDLSYIYQSERWNNAQLGNMAYTFDVAPGSYDVSLHFAEINFQSAGERIFSVDINGYSAIENLDIVAEVGHATPLVKTITAAAVDGKITIAFRNVVQNAKISAIEILPAGTVSNRIVKRDGLVGSAINLDVKAIGAGSLSIRSKAPFTASVKDFRGKQVASVQGTGLRSVSGLRAGSYIVEVRSGGRTVSYSVPIR